MTVQQIERLLADQRDALASRDPAALERANARLAAGLEGLRRTSPAAHDGAAARRARVALRAQAELVARGQASVERALSVLVPEAGPAYARRGPAASRPGGRHLVA